MNELWTYLLFRFLSYLHCFYISNICLHLLRPFSRSVSLFLSSYSVSEFLNYLNYNCIKDFFSRCSVIFHFLSKIVRQKMYLNAAHLSIVIYSSFSLYLYLSHLSNVYLSQANAFEQVLLSCSSSNFV